MILNTMYTTRAQLLAQQAHPPLLCTGSRRALVKAFDCAIDESDIPQQAIYRILGR